MHDEPDDRPTERSRDEPGILILVGTPLGNRGDLGPRARDAILSADLLLCEDTRSPVRLLGELGRARLPPRMSCFVGNELDRVAEVVARLDRGSRIVYVSEAGMPVWSDPGARLVRAVVDAGHTIDVIPGPTAVATAVCLSGFTGSDVHFLGFPPRSGSARTEFLERVAGESGTTVCYEGPGRVCDLLRDLARVAGGGRQAIVARELTKRHQEVLRGSLETLAARVTGALRGEVTLVVEGAREREQPSLAAERQAGAREVWAAICDPALKPRQRAKKIAAFTGLDTREIYTRLQTR